MTKTKISKVEIEHKLQKYLTQTLGVEGSYYVKLSKKRDVTSLGDLPESRPFGVDIDLAHKVYNWGHWKKIPAHKIMDSFLLECGKDLLELSPERPKDADNFAMRYYQAKIKPSKPKTLKKRKIKRVVRRKKK